MSQSDDELRDKVRKLYGYKKAHYINFEPRLEQLMHLFATHHARQSVALLEDLRGKMPDKVRDTPETDDYIPDDPGIAADQARNYTIEQALAVLDAEIERLKR